MRKVYIFIVIVFLLAVGLFIWYSYSNGEKVNNPTINPSGVSNGVNDPDELVYNFLLPDLDGVEYSLSDYLGKKPVILAFYASWCPNCQVNAPKLSLMAENYKNDVSVIGIDSKEEGENVKKFIEDNNVTHLVLVDIKGEVARNYGVGYNSFYVLLNKDGSVYKRLTGEIKEKDVTELIDRNADKLNSLYK